MTSDSAAAPRACFVDIHVLQGFSFANLNRDDMGSPKSLFYGGAQRGRVSSQCWKRQVRHLVEADGGDAAARTRRVPGAVAARLEARGWPADLAAFAGAQVLASAGKNGIKVEKDREGGAGMSAVLLWLPETALDALADLAADYRDDLEKEKGKTKNQRPVLPPGEVAELLTGRTGTVNLFGRMLAELPAGHVDGAVQVAHAFTVHASEPEIDFFATVDDVPSAADRGSGHTGTAEFTSGVFYRYACVDVAGLAANLGGDLDAARGLTGAFLYAFLAALPTGKRTATAPNTLPDLVYVAARDRPVSLAAAFEVPVAPAAEGGYGQPAREALAGYAARLHRLWGTGGIAVHGHAAVDPAPLDGLGVRHEAYAGLLDAAVDAACPPAGVPA